MSILPGAVRLKSTGITAILFRILTALRPENPGGNGDRIDMFCADTAVAAALAIAIRVVLFANFMVEN